MEKKRRTKRKIRGQIIRLESFNKRLEQMESESWFIRWLKKNKLRFRLTTKSIEYRYPHIQIIKAFVNDYRFFIHNSEKTSLWNLKLLYDELPIDGSIKKAFYSVRDYINEYLDLLSGIYLRNSEAPTNRQIQEIMLYGYISHEAKKKARIYQEWAREPWIKEEIWLKFCFIIYLVYANLLNIQEINKKAIEELEKLIK